MNAKAKTVGLIAAAALGLFWLANQTQKGKPSGGRPWTGWSAWPRAFWSPSSGR